MRLVPVLLVLALGTASAGGPKAKHSPAVQEIAKILTSGQPTREPARPDRYQLDAHWDPHHVWMIEVREEAARVTIRGGAVTDRDVTEFAKRLATSRVFRDVTVVSVERKHDRKAKTDYYELRLAATAVGADPNAPLVVTKHW